MNAKPKVAVVILNWNGKKYLEQFLPYVLASEYENTEVIVVDNHSTDESVPFLDSRFPEIRQIRFRENKGFAKGYNDALAEVSADYYVILNSDVEVKPDWIGPMVEMLEKDSRIAACQPKILSYANRGYFEYAGAAGGWMDKYGYPFSMGRVFDVCEQDTGQYDRAVPVFWASGAALFIRSEVFHKAGGFDEYFFAHQEEIDLCWRIQLAGYKIFSCPQSVVFHVGGGTLPHGNTLKTYLNFRNNQIMLYKNLPWTEKWWKIPFRLSLDMVTALKGLLSGEGGYFLAICRAHLAYGAWLFKRKGGRNTRKRATCKLDGVYNGNIVWEYFVRKRRKFSEIV